MAHRASAEGRRGRRQPSLAHMARPKGAGKSVLKLPARAPAEKVADDATEYGSVAQASSLQGVGGAAGKKRQIEQYAHADKQRPNNPPVGLVTPETDRDGRRTTYQYDPHLDPTLVWAGKAERTSFEIPTVSLHVHERIDPKTIIQAVKRDVAQASSLHGKAQPSLFDGLGENPPLREAIDFYRHPHGWSNRLIAGDSLLVMNSLLEKEGLGGKVQMVYIDPPYGIKYGSNFQPFVNKRDVKDGKDEDLTQEPEMIRAFRDTWELGIHSYLSYLRDRLLLAKELLHESGSCFVQISDENVHHVREMMDEIFGSQNFVAQISFVKTGGATSELLQGVSDFIIWYARERAKIKYHQLFEDKEIQESDYDYVELSDGTRRRLTDEEKQEPESCPVNCRIYGLHSLKSSGYREQTTVDFTFERKVYYPGANNNWKTTIEGLNRLAEANRIEPVGNGIRYRRYIEDFPVKLLTNHWAGGGASGIIYVVQTSEKPIARCMLMCTDPGDLVLDPTCGSGTTAYVAETWGRRWVTCDTSRVAVTLAKQRLMTAVYDYYELKHPHEGVASGFLYKTVLHVTLKSIAHNPEIKPGLSRDAIETAIKRHAETETLYDQPIPDPKKVRVTGPFTVEAVPAPTVKAITSVAQASSLPENGRQDACATKLRNGFHERGYLPHLKREGGTYFVTFRLAGTLPKAKLEELRQERSRAVAQASSLQVKERTEPSRQDACATDFVDHYLDSGVGDCWLKRPEIAGMVANALRHFDGQRYALHTWTIMPNHVHAVLTPHPQHSLTAILHSWKSFTANEANKLLGRSGQEFWERESYDHLVRDEEDFYRVCEYTRWNPVSAGLCQKPEEWRWCGVAQASSLPGVAQASRLQLEEEDKPSRQDACATAAVARSGPTLRHTEWRDELLKSGVRAKGGQKLLFSRVEPLSGCRWLHADAETADGKGQRVVLSFGPEHAPLGQKQVELAWEEARGLSPKPAMLLFAAFQFDPEAAKDIDELTPAKTGMTFLKVQMNTDLLTEDLKKKRASNESYWLIGQPDVEVRPVAQASSLQGKAPGRQDACATKYVVEVRGFDYYNPRTGAIESGDTAKIALWLLDTDYDGRSLFPRQVFFPLADDKGGWARLAKNLKAEIDESLIEAYRGTVSLPFDPGPHKRVAVKIVDDRGIESLKVVGIP